MHQNRSIINVRPEDDEVVLQRSSRKGNRKVSKDFGIQLPAFAPHSRHTKKKRVGSMKCLQESTRSKLLAPDNHEATVISSDEEDKQEIICPKKRSIRQVKVNSKKPAPSHSLHLTPASPYQPLLSKNSLMLPSRGERPPSKQLTPLSPPTSSSQPKSPSRSPFFSSENGTSANDSSSSLILPTSRNWKKLSSPSDHTRRTRLPHYRDQPIKTANQPNFFDLTSSIDRISSQPRRNLRQPSTNSTAESSYSLSHPPRITARLNEDNGVKNINDPQPKSNMIRCPEMDSEDELDGYKSRMGDQDTEMNEAFHIGSDLIGDRDSPMDTYDDDNNIAGIISNGRQDISRNSIITFDDSDEKDTPGYETDDKDGIEEYLDKTTNATQHDNHGMDSKDNMRDYLENTFHSDESDALDHGMENKDDPRTALHINSIPNCKNDDQKNISDNEMENDDIGNYLDKRHGSIAANTKVSGKTTMDRTGHLDIKRNKDESGYTNSDGSDGYGRHSFRKQSTNTDHDENEIDILDSDLDNAVLDYGDEYMSIDGKASNASFIDREINTNNRIDKPDGDNELSSSSSIKVSVNSRGNITHDEQSSSDESYHSTRSTLTQPSPSSNSTKYNNIATEKFKIPPKRSLRSTTKLSTISSLAGAAAMNRREEKERMLDGNVTTKSKTKERTPQQRTMGSRFSSRIREKVASSTGVEVSTPVELSDDEADAPNHTVLFTYPLNRSKGSVTITMQDRSRLEPFEFLNDSVIDFYLKWLMDSYGGRNEYDAGGRKNLETVNSTHIFSTLFYNRLTQGDGKHISYENVRKWTTNIDLFDKKYAIFPINENWHWYLVVVCNLNRCIPGATDSGIWDLSNDSDDMHNRPYIFILDSLGGRQRKCVYDLMKYIQMEAASRRNVEMADFIKPGFRCANVPRQTNTCDCGVYLLHFVDLFLNSPREFIEILLGNDPAHRLWKEDKIKEKREEIKILFKSIHQQYMNQYGTEPIM